MSRDLSSDTLVYTGGEPLKSLEVKDGVARVGSYGIRFSGPEQKDFYGDYFTKDTDYGPRAGDGAATMFNHGFPVADGLEYLASKTFAPVKAVKDDLGIFVETVLNLSDDYEKAIYELAQSGKLKWSSGTAAHLMRRAADGQILRWHPIEFSYTPTPAEPRLPAIMPMKSYLAELTQPVDKPKAADSKDSKTISVINNPTMTPEEIATKEAADKKAFETRVNDAVNARAKEVQEIFAIGNAFGKATEADEFVKSGKSLAEFQNIVLNGLKARPVDPDAGKIGMSDKEQKRYSLMKALREMAGNGLTGLEKECHEAAVKATGRSTDNKTFMIPEDVVRGFGRVPVRTVNQVTQATAGGFLVDTDMGPMIELLRNKPQVVAAGATSLNGLVGDVVLPVQTAGATAYWVAETGALTDSNATFGQKKLTPKRLGVTIPYSTQLLAQTSMDAEAIIRNDAVRVLALEKDRAALLGSGAAGEPVGIANTTGINATVTYSNAAVWDDVIEHETGVCVDNADISSMAFMLDAATVGKWKTALKVATYGGTGYLIDPTGPGNSMSANGYPVFRTNQIGSAHQSFFGCWDQLILASWAGLEVIVDPFALKKSGQIEITFNELCDILVRQPLAFNVSTDSAAQ
jgi:HK97 family phage major capsid protein